MNMALRYLFSPRKRRALEAKQRAKVKVLMVCKANICRSPLAQVVLRRQLERAGIAEQVFVDSAGTHSYEGAPPDLRGQRVAAERGIDLSDVRSRLLSKEDLDEFDYVLAMDQENYQHVLTLCETPAQRQRVQLLMRYAPALRAREVIDPYYGGVAGFERAFDLLEQATAGLLRHIRQHHRL
jgi:protein-tyrosine phosphatase